jgi:hypothetical protein
MAASNIGRRKRLIEMLQDKQNRSATECRGPAGRMADATEGIAEVRRTHRALWWAAVVAFCLLPAVIALTYIHAYGLNGVVDDGLSFPPLFQKYYYRTLTFQDFYAQDNEHRPLFPRLVMLALGLATRYNNVAEMYVGWGFICLSAVPVFLLCRRLYPDGLTAAAVFIPAAWILFSLGQTESLLRGWLLILFMGNAFLLLSMYFMERARSLDGWMIASAAAGLVASFCTASMLLLWPIGLATIILKNPSGETPARNGRMAAVVFWILSGIVVWAAYFANWRAPHQSGYEFGLQHPWMFVRFICNYISAPLGPGKDGRILLLLMYMGGAALAFWRWRRSKTLAAMPMAMILFVFGTALITGVSRARFGTHQALVSRYQVFSGLGLIGLYLLCLPLLSEVHLKIAKYDATRLLGVVLLFFAVVRPMYVEAYAEGEPTLGARILWAYRLRTASMQSDRVMGAFWDPALVRQDCDILRRLRFNVFADQPPALSAGMRQLDEKDLPHCIELFTGPFVPSDSQTVMFRKEMDTISVIGNAQDKAARSPAGGVFIELDGAMDVPAAYGLPRPELAINTGTPGYYYSGFEADFAASILKAGQHSLRVKVVSADWKSYALSAEALVFEIPGPSPLPVAAN